jgi:Raf kinase inhibitor-like YbhB/YbcL family protein
MPDPGSHGFDIKRTRVRGAYERDHVLSVPDQHADEAARADLERDHPPRRPDDDRAAGPLSERPPSGPPPAPPPGEITLRSPAFSDHDFIPRRFTGAGDNAVPTIEWSAPPAGTAELELICEDIDAPGGSFIHWVVTGIPPRTPAIEDGRLPQGAACGPNGFGETGWGGPMPPVGDEPHRYVFRLFAVDTPLRLGAGASAAHVRHAVEGHDLATGTLVGLFGR